MTANRVWIELEYPKDAQQGEERCALVNRMLSKACAPAEATQNFFWSERDECYCYGGDGGFVTCSDRGHWFNLDALATGKEQQD